MIFTGVPSIGVTSAKQEPNDVKNEHIQDHIHVGTVVSNFTAVGTDLDTL